MNEEKAFHLRLIAECDNWGDTCGYRVKNITEDPSVGKMLYSVHNLCECPEDATVDRDLVSGYEYISILKLGMRIRDAGYTSISYVEEEEKY